MGFLIKPMNDLTEILFYLVFVSVVAAFGYVLYLYKKLDSIPVDDPKAKEVADAIREGAYAFMKRQYRTILMISVVVAVLIAIGFLTVLQTEGGEGLVDRRDLAVWTAVAFLLGTVASMIAGYISMDVATRTNSRTAMQARESLPKAFRISFDGGLVLGLSVVAMSLIGVTVLFLSAWAFGGVVSGKGAYGFEVSPILIVGFGFGASFSALFAQLGGGIYTKGADVGADLVGKVEAGIPEDDPRNPAVIADLTGDNVGDIAGRGADLFESMTAENIGSMIIATGLGAIFGIHGFIFPLLLRAGGIFATLIGQYLVTMKEDEKDPMRPMMRALYITSIIAAIIFAFLTWGSLGLPTPDQPESNLGFAWVYIWLAAVLGIITSIVIGWITDYYTNSRYGPVKEVAEASKTGVATNILTGTAIGFETNFIPIVVLVAAVIIAFILGMQFASTINQAIPGTDNDIHLFKGGIYGTAAATMGMLATGGIILAMDGYGPITDNAAGVAEMGGLPSEVRERCDILDAAGNTTKAFTKGYAVGSAALAAFLLFEAYASVAAQFLGKDSVFSSGFFEGSPFFSMVNPLVTLGGFLGAMTVFLFAAQAIRAVSRTAQSVIEEVRRQFNEIKGLKEGVEGVKPEYGVCVDIVTRSALKNMIIPTIVVTVTPILTGFILGPEAVAGYLMFGTVAGILMANYLNNAGATWDNAKKYIEEGHLGGKGSDAHAAAVSGDTVGDPFKDTAGPSLHILIKLINNITITFGGLFATTFLLKFISMYLFGASIGFP